MSSQFVTAQMLLVGCLLCSGCRQPKPSTVEDVTDLRPALAEFATSESCQECHQKEYDSWHDSFHRTMTQEASEGAIVGRFDDSTTEVNGYPVELKQEGDLFLMKVVDPKWEAFQLNQGRDPRSNDTPPMVTYSVDRVIGSHHQQVYLSKRADGTYVTLPLVWSIRHDRWMTRGSSFLSHHQRGFFEKTKTWNNGCIFCHNTAPRPGLKQSVTNGQLRYHWESEVAELGISCEACHGPGEQHVVHQQALATGEQSNGERQTQESLIVNPKTLSHQEMSLVCARCHGKMLAKEQHDRDCLVNGDFFVSGEFEFPDYYDIPWHEVNEPFDEQREGQYFWKDGTPRTTALEYQGLLQSPCYQQGELSCLSCHSMHDSEPNDQLRFGDGLDVTNELSNQACTQCHQSFSDSDQLAAHTHHSAESSGSLCYNCHMPYQAYSLLKRVRSHRISIPSNTQTSEYDKPNACNQCHVDESLDWTRRTLAAWQDQELDSEIEQSSETSITAIHALSGHALQRALALEQLSAEETFAVAGGISWRARLFVEALEDPYPAIRIIAYQGLKKLPGFKGFEFDFIGTQQVRQKQISEARERLDELSTRTTQEELIDVLGGDDISEIDSMISELIRERNNVPMGILE